MRAALLRPTGASTSLSVTFRELNKPDDSLQTLGPVLVYVGALGHRRARSSSSTMRSCPRPPKRTPSQPTSKSRATVSSNPLRAAQVLPHLELRLQRESRMEMQSHLHQPKLEELRNKMEGKVERRGVMMWKGRRMLEQMRWQPDWMLLVLRRRIRE